jgi:hypothetical protein
VISVVAVALPKPAPVKLGVKYKVYGIGLLVEGLTAVSFPLSVPVVFAVPPASALKAYTWNDALFVHCTVVRLPVEYTGAEVDGSIPRAMLLELKVLQHAFTVALIRTVWSVQRVGGAANAPPAMAITIIVIAATKIFVFIVVLYFTFRSSYIVSREKLKKLYLAPLLFLYLEQFYIPVQMYTLEEEHQTDRIKLTKLVIPVTKRSYNRILCMRIRIDVSLMNSAKPTLFPSEMGRKRRIRLMEGDSPIFDLR